MKHLEVKKVVLSSGSNISKQRLDNARAIGKNPVVDKMVKQSFNKGK